MSEKITLMEKYFPQKFDDLYLPERIQILLDKNKNRKGYRLLLYGPAGTGKTSSARLLNQNATVLFKSGSNDFSIETLRQSIYPFISSHAHVMNKQKTVIIDECERMSGKVQDAFKVVLDQATNVNFIFITNEIEKITPFIKSRCDLIEFNYRDGELKTQKINYLQNIINICKAENLKYDDKGVKFLLRRYFPDFRQILRILQQFIDTGKDITNDNVLECVESAQKDTELYAIFSLDEKQFYEKATQYKGREKETFQSLGEPFFEWLNDQNKYIETLKCAEVVAKYSNQYVTTFNKFVCLFSCLTEIKNILR